MRLEDQQEQLSIAALHGTCAKAGFSFHVSERIQDNRGVDAETGVYEKLSPDSVLTDFKLRFQLKATRQQLTCGPNGYSFVLETSHYNRLRRSDADAPLFLVVFQMPDDETQWFDVSPQQLVMRRCLRYVSLRNAPPTDNDTSVTVYLPETQLLDPDALRKLALKRSLGQWTDYGHAV